MKIIIQIKEIRPGVVNATVDGVGVASPLEKQMTDHVAAAIDAAMKTFPVRAGGSMVGRMESKDFRMGKG